MTIYPLLHTFASSNRPRFDLGRSVHLTWILLLHLILIYLLQISQQTATSVRQERAFKTMLQWVFVRTPSSTTLPGADSQVRADEHSAAGAIASSTKLNSLRHDQKNLQPAETSKSQTRDQTLDHQANAPQAKDSAVNRDPQNKGVDEIDPFALPTDIARLNHVQQRYRVQVPREEAQEPENLTPAQQAAKDVRTNSPKLSKSELFAQAVGNLECIYQTRLANGKLIREPGKWIVVPARSEPGQPKNIFKARFCVRLHQNDDADGNDLTEISAGLRGK